MTLPQLKQEAREEFDEKFPTVLGIGEWGNRDKDLRVDIKDFTDSLTDRAYAAGRIAGLEECEGMVKISKRGTNLHISASMSPEIQEAKIGIGAYDQALDDLLSSLEASKKEV